MLTAIGLQVINRVYCGLATVINIIHLKINKMNAKNELLQELEGKNIKCAQIAHDYYRMEKKEINLKVNFSENDFKEFLNKLDFEYDDGFGTQELHGLVWLEDGTWLSRHEYDGAENWEHNKLPEIPTELL